MARNKLTLDFKGFEEYAEKLDRIGGDLKTTCERALQNSHDFVTPKIHSAMKKHHRTGNTEASILDNAQVRWEGSIASVDVGFDLSAGGFPSIFLMYGTPRMKKDQELYDAIYGNKTKKQIKELQEKTFARTINKVTGG